MFEGRWFPASFVFCTSRAPDGTCILANSNDNCLRLFNLPDELYYEGGENKNIQEMVSTVINRNGQA